MVKRTVDIEYPDGTDLAWSRKSDGGRSPLVRDASGDLVTQVVIFERGHQDARNLERVVLVALGVAAGALGAIAVVNAPKIRKWLSGTALPAIRSKWSRVARTGESDSQAATAEMAALSGVAPTDFSSEVDAVLEESRTGMSSAEAQERLLAVLVAAAFIAEQIRALSNARIGAEDDDEVLALKSALGRLTALEVTDSINLLLETSASPLDEEASAEILRIFGGGKVVDGRYVPLTNVKIRDALRLTP
jgi:hypothetical protein